MGSPTENVVSRHATRSTLFSSVKNDDKHNAHCHGVRNTAAGMAPPRSHSIRFDWMFWFSLFLVVNSGHYDHSTSEPFSKERQVETMITLDFESLMHTFIHAHPNLPSHHHHKLYFSPAYTIENSTLVSLSWLFITPVAIVGLR
ncbi:uncharacterized protein CLUP02_05078 [Colletotrichum lupini]|uniref:Uncharacterized protein n=1 Tax=Colletotrichum lupini TaxID=145971 RepID=A0A9Q8WDC9_9PEZI|nr:uncharacterized protein CLUP02_05078 [Colletotrichum lupini]UQC79598.1 hypothetical protein CLUP02_05078 [Colletotrichum lupini]